MKNYPPTQDAYDALCSRLTANRARAREAGRLGSVNVPKGWAGRKGELADIRQEAAELADRAVVRIPGYDDWDRRAKMAMTQLFAIALDASIRVALRLKAISVALEYLQAKPATLSQIQAGGRDVHLDWLRKLATG